MSVLVQKRTEASAKERYKKLCADEPSIPLFSQAWWLDATAGAGRWDVALVRKGDEIVASMPYMLRKRYGFTFIGQPAMTQCLGPWLRNFGGKPAQQLVQQKDRMQSLIEQLPAFDYFSQSWDSVNTNWLPFYWNGFHQTTRYSYILHDLSDKKALWDGFLVNIRTDINKASNRHQLKVRDDLTIDDFLHLNKKTFQRQGMAVPYSEDFVKKLDEACVQRNARKILIAEDDQGRRHAGAYIVWDSNCAYYLMGGGDPELRNSGATSLCMWAAIQFAATVTQRFDFEGSMIEPVEKFFRAFGATQTPYFLITKTPSRLIRTVRFLRELRHGV